MGHIFLHVDNAAQAVVERRLRKWAGLAPDEKQIPYLQVPCHEETHYVVSAGLCKMHGDLPFTSEGEVIGWKSYIGPTTGAEFRITKSDVSGRTT